MALTTLKVPTELRDRIASEARAEHITIATLLDRLMREHEYRQRMRAVGESMRAHPVEDDYWREFADLDAIGGGVADA